MQICEACGQPIKEARQHEMNGYMIDMLRVAAKHVIETGVNNFKKGDIGEELHQLGPSAYGNFPQLRYFGLIHYPYDKKTGRYIQRRWLITRQGWAFLRGEWECRKSVVIKNGHIVEELSTTERIDIRGAGGLPMQTLFEYFDEDGRLVALRPQPPRVAENARLL